jgi:hypothetical protein
MEREIALKTILLKEGEISNQVDYIKKGCLRVWFNKDGKDITFQFFLKVRLLLQLIVLLTTNTACILLKALSLKLFFQLAKITLRCSLFIIFDISNLHSLEMI